MSFFRPQARAVLTRWREVGLAGLVAGSGLWLMALGGYFLGPLGAICLLLGGAWGLLSWRRMGFLRPVTAPGVVELDEGQVGYLGPSFGGYVALRELVEIRIVTLHRQQHWRLKQSDGQVLLIPLAAIGAEGLFDAYAALPGVDMSAMAAALESPADTQVVWRRPTHAALT